MTAALTTPPAGPTPAPAAARPTRCGRGELVALGVLLTGTAGLYLWDLAASRWANSYYAAAVQAMTQDWTAFFFGSLDTGNVITVDKPPASLWVMALSARVFGFSSWSMLVPQALMGVASVALLYGAVRPVSGPRAALVAGAVLALTPVAALMFRYNNPDALLVLLMVAAAYATVCAIEKAGARWLLLAGALIGFAFLAKMAQAFLMLPGLALAYLVAAPTGFWRRIHQLLAAGVAIVVSAGWWIAAVELWPSGSRPYIGGSKGNSALQLALSYNGLGRIFGGGGNSGGGTAMAGAPSGGVGPSGEAGWLRMFTEAVGGQISWLLPAALALLVAGLWLTRRAPRTGLVRASLIIWGGWTIVTAVLFSLMSGIFHEYYTIALAPGIAALVAIGGRELCQHRSFWTGRVALAIVAGGTAAWAWVLLSRVSDFVPWLRWVIVAAGALTVVVLLGAVGRPRAAAVTALALVVTGLAGPTAYALNTATTPHSGGIVSAGPQTSRQVLMHSKGPLGELSCDLGPTNAELVALLQSAGTKWSAATTAANSSARLQLDSGTSVITIGGWAGGDPAPTLAEFQAMVAAGQVHYYVKAGDSGGFGGGDRSGSKIAWWVMKNFTPTTVGGRTVYDLASPVG